MQPQPFLTNNGQEVQQDDYNRGWQVAALADDVALSALARLPLPSGSNPYRAILPYTQRGVDNSVGTVASGTGGVVVNSFWGLIGTRDATKLTDIRTAPFNNPSATLALAANTSGFTRIDLVYATVFVDAPMSNETRFLKDPTTGNITSTSLPTQKRTYVVVSVQAGTPSGSPAVPALPSDPVGGYNIPLALVRVDNGFGALSVITNSKIMDTSPSVSITHGAGPADQMSTAGSAFFDGVNKTKNFIARSAVGKAERFFALDTSVGSINGAVIDSSVDWRKRAIHIVWQSGAAGEEFAWHSSTSTSLPMQGAANVALANSFVTGLTDKVVFSVTIGGGTLALVVDHTTGYLKVSITGTPNASAFFWISASQQFPNT